MRQITNDNVTIVKDISEQKILEQLKIFRLLKTKEKVINKVANIQYLEEDISEIGLFDLIHHTKKGEMVNARTVFFAVANQYNFPTTLLRPEGLKDKAMSSIWLATDIDFSNSPVFSNRYWLEGKEKGIIRTMYTKDVRTFLAKEKNWYIETHKNAIIIAKKNKLITNEVLQPFRESCLNILTMLVK